MYNSDESLYSLIHKIKLESNYHISRILKAYDLTYPQALILLTIDRYQNISISDLSDVTLNSLANTSSLVKRLLKLDLIVKEKDHNDQRMNVLSLSNKSKAMIKDIQNAITCFEESFEKINSKEELDEIYEGLDLLYKKLKEMRGNYEIRN